MKIWEAAKLAIMIIAGACVIYSGIEIVRYIKDGAEQKEISKTIKQSVQEEISKNATSNVNTNQQDSDSPTLYELEYEKLLDINIDSIGWITIANTNIDYPVLKTSDNEFYLDHDINKNDSVHGSIFMDWKNNIDDRHIVIYGHNMKDGTMFGELKKYRKQDYYNNNSIIELNIEGQNTRWQIFSVKYTDSTPYCTVFVDEHDYLNYISVLKEESLYDTGIIISESDRILTLSTCSKVFRDARFVVHAKQLEPDNISN